LAVTCDECRERLQELVDDELAARERKAVESHLSSCATCTQEYKEVAHFTTTVAKAVRPLGPSAELSSKVLTTYHESREQLKAAPVAAPLTGRKALPSWAWLVAIGVLVLTGLAVLLWPSGAPGVGHVKPGAKGVRVLSYSNAGWQPATRTRLCAGDRVEATGTGTDVALDLGVWGEATLKAPCAVQVDCAGETLAIQLLPQAPGTIVLSSRAAPAAGAKRLRVTWASAWIEVNAADRNEVTVVPLTGQGGGWTGQLKVSVKAGAARLGNTGTPQTVAEGFSRVVPQSGECEAPVKTE
jgi:hypothetical protein